MDKQRVFEIMGKLYGNDVYRAAIQFDDTENDLRVIKDILDEINSFGYSVCSLSRLNDVEDIRVVSVILKHYRRFDAIRYRCGVLSAIKFRSYAGFVPNLLEIYHSCNSREIRNTISSCLLLIRDRTHVEDYLRIVLEPGYGCVVDYRDMDYMMALLCELRVTDVLPKLLALVKTSPLWNWTFLRYAAYFKDPSVIEHLAPFLESDDAEYRTMAKKAIHKLKLAQRNATCSAETHLKSAKG